jgi:hypothetical protein
MDNPIELLSELMKNKDAVDNVKNMLSTTDETNTDDMSFLIKMLSENKQGVQIVSKMKGLYDAYNDNNDPAVRLLNDLTPFLSERRVANINRISKIAKISKALNKLGRG